MSLVSRIPRPDLRHVVVGALVLTLGTANIVLAGGGGLDPKNLVSIIDAITGTAAKVDAAGNLNVSVANLPAIQNVAGTVNVGNLPASQTVNGTVNVGNLPATVELYANGSFVNVNAGELKALATLDVSHVEKLRIAAFNVGANQATFALSMVTSNNQLVALLDEFQVGPGEIVLKVEDMPGRTLILFVDQRNGGATSVQVSVWGR